MNEMLAIVGLPGWLEIVVICFFALILFGRRLPLVARAIGQSVVELRRGLQSARELPGRVSQPTGSHGALDAVMNESRLRQNAAPVDPT